MWATTPAQEKPMNPQLLPVASSGDPSAWEEAIYAFLVERGNRSGSSRTVEGHARMLSPNLTRQRGWPTVSGSASRRGDPSQGSAQGSCGARERKRPARWPASTPESLEPTLGSEPRTCCLRIRRSRRQPRSELAVSGLVGHGRRWAWATWADGSGAAARYRADVGGIARSWTRVLTGTRLMRSDRRRLGRHPAHQA